MTSREFSRPEVLAPAGDMERLEMALTYGADAVYLALRRFGMRAASGNFGSDELKTAAAMCRSRGVKLYVACNTVMHGDDIAALPEAMSLIAGSGADAVIVSDLGALAIAKKHAPDLPVHMSTQTGVANAEAARLLHAMGAKRVILARELTLSEIAAIRADTPAELELETFVHGSMCVSFSGRCLLSNYMTGRDANRGACAQPCRWKYRLIEEKRPDEAFEITEDGGTYILNSRDLCMIDHIPELISAGVTSLKIEGRMKSAYYAAVTTNAYRRAAGFAARGEPLPDVWRNEVNKVSHREYSTGFFFDPEGPGQSYKSAMYQADCDVAAIVEECGPEGRAKLTQRNRFFEGDVLTLLTPDGEPVDFTAAGMTDAEGNAITSTPHPMMEFYMTLPRHAPRLSIIRKEKNKGEGSNEKFRS